MSMSTIEHCNLLIAENTQLKQERDSLAAQCHALRDALQYYAEQSHFIIVNGAKWDKVSCEPPSLWYDEAGTATVEDGSIAKHALKPSCAADILRARDERQKKATYREFFDELARLLKKSQFSIKQDGRSVKAKFIRTLRTTCDELEQKNG